MREDVVKPSKVLYVISGLILLCGVSFFVYLLITGISSSIGNINIQVVVPGTEIIEIKETGKYTIFYEHSSVIDGKVYKTNSINGLICSLKNVETGELIKLNSSLANSSYALAGREGKGIFSFDINKTGEYEFKGWYESGNGEEVVLAIGKGFAGSLVRTILLSIVTLLITIGMSVIIFIYTLTRRKRNKTI